MKKQILGPIFIIAGVIIILIILISFGERPDRSVGTSQGQSNLSNSAAQRVKSKGGRTLEDDDAVLGNLSAPVTIVEFGDYQCTFCTRFFFETKDKIVENYVKTGKVKMIFRDLAINGRESIYAAEAAECADDQNKYWEYHDILFQNRKGYNVGAFKQDKLKEYASGIENLNQNTFNECVDKRLHKDEVAADSQDARFFGAQGTPTFFINGIRVVGAQPYNVFAQIIEQELAALQTDNN